MDETLATTEYINESERNTVKEIKKILRIWDRTANRLVYLTVIFGIITIVTSVLVSVYFIFTFSFMLLRSAFANYCELSRTYNDE